MKSLRINGHHIYTIVTILPFLYRFRIGLGRWRYTCNGFRLQELCDDVAYRVTVIVR